MGLLFGSRPSLGTVLACVVRSTLGALALLHCLWCVLPAAAQDDKAQARALFGDGVSAFDRGDYAAALQSFQGAYRLAPHPAVRVNMANCFEQLGKYVEAAFNYERFLQESGSDVPPEQRAEVEAAIQRLNGKIGTLFITTEPGDAALSVDGEPTARVPGTGLKLSAGTHTLRATRPGYVASERMLQVDGGAERSISLSLYPAAIEPEAAPPASEPAREPVMELQSNEARRDSSANLRPVMWVALGSAAVFGVGAAVTGGLAIKAQNDFDDSVARSNDPSVPPPAREQARSDGVDAADRADLYATVTDVLIAGSAVGATTAFVLWLVDRKRERSESSLAFTPAVAPNGRSAQWLLRGTF